MTSEDRYTHTEADAGRFDYAHHAIEPDLPTRAELDASEMDDAEHAGWPPFDKGLDA